MSSRGKTDQQPAIAVLGGTGRFGEPYIREFLRLGLNVRILARAPERVGNRFPRAHVHRGTMLNPSNVKRVMAGTAAAFLITPVGGNDDTRIELTAAKAAIAGAQAARLPHLILLSLLQQPRPTGVPVLDVKGEIEALIQAGGIPWSSLRTGCYMDAWLEFFPLFMKLGLYLFPIQSRHRFSFTAQQDVARIAARLIAENRVLNGPLDVIDPRARTLRDVADLYEHHAGHHLMLMGRWVLPLLTILKPVFFRWAYPRDASRIRLFNYFNRNTWVGDANQLSTIMQGFHATTLEAHLQSTADHGC